MCVMAAFTLKSSRDLLALHRFGLVLLDLQLEQEDGMALVKELDLQGGPPVIIVSARAEEAERVLGLELGADDYLVKPFSFRELIARIHVVQRRAGERRHRLARHRVARFGIWTVDLTSHRVQDQTGHSVHLTAGELAVLRAFLEHPGRVLWRHELLALTRSKDSDAVDRAIDVLVARLRRKLESDPRRPMLITTIRGAGYRFGHAVAWEVADSPGAE
jgi:DNA-binding response OmpR family regulator